MNINELTLDSDLFQFLEVERLSGGKVRGCGGVLSFVLRRYEGADQLLEALTTLAHHNVRPPDHQLGT